MKIRVCAILACLLAGIVASSAHAAPLGLSLEDSPRIASGLVDVSYSASTDEFVASGVAFSLRTQSFWSPIFPIGIDNFNISATIDEFGTASAGALSITGSLLGIGPTLLTGTLTDFGFPDSGGDPFEFLFTIDGGALGIPELFGGPGSIVGVVLDANGGNFSGDFSDSFSNTISRRRNGFLHDWHHHHDHGHGAALIAPIPEPATLVLILAGAIVWRRGLRA